jgi:putative ABC transport system ATP-binding protein
MSTESKEFNETDNPDNDPDPAVSPRDVKKEDPVPIISLRDVNKIYRLGMKRITALSDINLDIYEGDYITIQGPSGCGKSTFLHVAGTMDRPTSGDVIIHGNKTADLTDDEITEIRGEHIGFVFQFYNLIEYLSALENVSLGIDAIKAKNKIKPEESRKMAREVLEKLGLGERVDNKIEELSGGEQQRVAIARALVKGPSIIIADEPTGDLDTTTGEEILKIFENLNDEGHTILIVSHDPGIGKRGKRRITMKDSKITSDSGA